MIRKADKTNEKTKASQPDQPPYGTKADERLPASISTLIGENILHLSGASNFFKKRADAAVLLRDFVEPLPNSCYRLKNGFDRVFSQICRCSLKLIACRRQTLSQMLSSLWEGSGRELIAEGYQWLLAQRTNTYSVSGKRPAYGSLFYEATHALGKFGGAISTRVEQ